MSSGPTIPPTAGPAVPAPKTTATLREPGSKSGSSVSELSEAGSPQFSDLVLKAAAERRVGPPVLSDKDKRLLAQGVFARLRQETSAPLGIDGLPDPLAPIVDHPIAPADLTAPGALLAHVVALEDYERRIDIKLDDLSSPALFGRWGRFDLHGTMVVLRRIRDKLAWWAAAPVIRVDRMGEKLRSDKAERAGLRKDLTVLPKSALAPTEKPKRSHDFD